MSYFRNLSKEISTWTAVLSVIVSFGFDLTDVQQNAVITLCLILFAAPETAIKESIRNINKK